MCDLCNVNGHPSGWWASGGPPGLEHIERCPNHCVLAEVDTCEHLRVTPPMDGNYGGGSQWCKDCGASRSDYSGWSYGCVMCKGKGRLWSHFGTQRSGVPCPMCALYKEGAEQRLLIRQALEAQKEEGML